MSSDKSEHSEHILPSTMYWGIWALLIVLTFVTAWVANIDLGRFNTVVALLLRPSRPQSSFYSSCM